MEEPVLVEGSKKSMIAIKNQKFMDKFREKNVNNIRHLFRHQVLI